MFKFTMTKASISRGLRFLLVSFSAGQVGLAYAAMPTNPTQAEIAVLPPFCADSQTFGINVAIDSPRSRYWMQLMGKNFWNIHHYCYALMYLARAQRELRSAENRRFNLGQAVVEFQYVIERGDAAFALAPEVYYQKGVAEILLADYAAALDSFQNARKIKPDYWPAYSKWAEVLIKSGQKVEAKKLVKEGLEHSPESVALRDQYKQLGGNPDEVQPVVKRAPPVQREALSEGAADPLTEPAASLPKP